MSLRVNFPKLRLGLGLKCEFRSEKAIKFEFRFGQRMLTAEFAGENLPESAEKAAQSGERLAPMI